MHDCNRGTPLQPYNALLLAHAASALDHDRQWDGRHGTGRKAEMRRAGASGHSKCRGRALRSCRVAAWLAAGRHTRLGECSPPVRSGRPTIHCWRNRQRRTSALRDTYEALSYFPSVEPASAPAIHWRIASLTVIAHAHMVLGNYTKPSTGPPVLSRSIRSTTPPFGSWSPHAPSGAQAEAHHSLLDSEGYVRTSQFRASTLVTAKDRAGRRPSVNGLRLAGLENRSEQGSVQSRDDGTWSEGRFQRARPSAPTCFCMRREVGLYPNVVEPAAAVVSSSNRASEAPHVKSFSPAAKWRIKIDPATRGALFLNPSLSTVVWLTTRKVACAPDVVLSGATCRIATRSASATAQPCSRAAASGKESLVMEFGYAGSGSRRQRP